MSRRNFLSKFQSGVAVGISGVLAGCSSTDNKSSDQTGPPENQRFRYFFQDKPGTLGAIAEHNQPPEDASDWQVIENTRTEDDWKELRLNDIEYAEAYMAGETIQPTDGTPGTPEEIITRTQELYESAGASGPVAFTEALVAAEDEISGADFPNRIVTNIAKYAIEELGYEFPAYSLSPIRAVQPVPASYDGLRPETIRETSASSPVAPDRIGTFGEMRTTLYLLTFETSNGAQVRYVDRPPFNPWYLYDTLRKPTESVYREPLSKDFYTMRGTQGRPLKQYPEHFVTSLDYRKAAKMREQDLLKDGELRKSLVGSALSIVENGEQDKSRPAGTALGCNDNRGYQIERLSHEFGASVDDFVTNPSTDQRKRFIEFGRAIYLIFETQFGKDYRGDPVFGYDQPLKIAGTLAAPELYHLPKEC
jgi:hypothetical protein